MFPSGLGVRSRVAARHTSDYQTDQKFQHLCRVSQALQLHGRAWVRHIFFRCDLVKTLYDAIHACLRDGGRPVRFLAKENINLSIAFE